MGISLDTLKNIGTKVLPWIGTIGTLGGSAMGLFGTNAKASMLKQYNYQRLLQQQQYDLTQQGYRESPTNQRIGLESAGYNPILAVNNGLSYGNYSSGQSTAAMDSNDNVNNGLIALQTLANIQKTNAEKDYIETQTENLGNSPSNFIGNFIKGFTKNNDMSSVSASSIYGTKTRDLIDNFIQKIFKYKSYKPSFELGISNYDNGFIKYIKKSNQKHSKATNASSDIDILSDFEINFLHKLIKSAYKELPQPPKELPY